MSERFIQAEARDGGDAWVAKSSRGQLVTVAERNAFVGQAAGIMDVLAAPGRLLTPAGVVPPTTVYRGPDRAWNGRTVPLLGGVEPPALWLVKPPRTASGVEPPKGWDLRALLEPTMDERRRYWLALHGTLKGMAGSYEIAEANAPRTAGVLPVAAVVIIAVAAVAALAGVIGYVAGTSIHENAETARHAGDIEAAARAYVQRLQWAAEHPGAPFPPPSAAEVRVQTPPPAAPPGSASPLDRAVNDALASLVTTGGRVLLVGAGLMVAAVVLPPILSNLADRATRERHA